MGVNTTDNAYQLLSYDAVTRRMPGMLPLPQAGERASMLLCLQEGVGEVRLGKRRVSMAADDVAFLPLWEDVEMTLSQSGGRLVLLTLRLPCPEFWAERIAYGATPVRNMRARRQFSALLGELGCAQLEMGETALSLRVQELAMLFFNEGELPATHPEPPRAIRQMKELMDRDCSQALTLEDLSETLGASKYYLSRAFHQWYGETANCYLTKARMERAKYLLSSTRKDIAAISDMVGYSDCAYFVSVFRKHTGTTPLRWRTANCVK